MSQAISKEVTETFFAIPPDLAKRIAQLAWHSDYISPTARILEPNAGEGSLVRAMAEFYPTVTSIDCYEATAGNRTKLLQIGEAKVISDDFMAEHVAGKIFNSYDIAISITPFSKNQDIDHIKAMYAACKVNGRIVSVASMSWVHGSQKKQVEFREWLKKVDAFQEELPAGTFETSGTKVGAMLLVIDKLESVLPVAAPVEVVRNEMGEVVDQPTEEAPVVEESAKPEWWGTGEILGDPTPLAEAIKSRKKASEVKRFVVLTAAFLAVLKKAKEVISKNPTLPIVDNILIKVRRKDMQVIATDCIITIIAEVPIDNDHDFGYEFLLPFKFTHDTMQLINDMSVTIELKEKEKKLDGKKITVLSALLTTFSDKYDLDCLDNTDTWPKLPEFPHTNSVGVGDGFIEWLNLLCDTAVPEKDNSRPALQKIYIGITSSGIVMASTNANVVSEKSFPCDSSHDVDLLVSTKIAKALKGFKETSISWSDTHMAFVSSNMTIIGTVQDERYPNYRGAFPIAESNITLSLAELTGAIQKVSLTGSYAEVWLKREIGHIVIESFDFNHDRKITVRIGADYAGDCDKVLILPEQLLKLLGQVKYQTLSLAITAPNRAVLITTASDDTYRSLIMPQIV